MKQWYEELFENYAETYDAEKFTKGTIGECISPRAGIALKIVSGSPLKKGTG